MDRGILCSFLDLKRRRLSDIAVLGVYTFWVVSIEWGSATAIRNWTTSASLASGNPLDARPVGRRGLDLDAVLLSDGGLTLGSGGGGASGYDEKLVSLRERLDSDQPR